MPREIVPMILNAGMLMLWDIAVGGVGGVVTAGLLVVVVGGDDRM